MECLSLSIILDLFYRLCYEIIMQYEKIIWNKNVIGKFILEGSALWFFCLNIFSWSCSQSLLGVYKVW